jgi:PDZ domain-containing protein
VPPPSPVNSNQQNVCDMTDSQATAKLVALTKLGYKPQPLPGVQIQVVEPAPAADVLQCGDVIDSVNGKATKTPTDLQAALATHKPGDLVNVTFRRNGATTTKPVQLACADPNPDQTGRAIDAPESATCRRPGAQPRIGILVDTQYRYPVDIQIDTGDVSGPSGGLAMTLTLLDLLTPCNLTGGQKIAVTGTIGPDGSVGGIGGTPKKVIAARHAGAKLFIVAAGSDDLAAARKAAQGMKFVVVHNLDEALKALQDNGGDPLSCTSPPAQG